MAEVPLAHLLLFVPTGELRLALGRQPTTIGRDTGCTIVLSDPAVAERQCIVQPNEDGTFDVFDLFTELGTWVNGKRVEASELKTGDQLTVGGTRLVFVKAEELKGAAPRRAPPPASGPILPFADEAGPPADPERTIPTRSMPAPFQGGEPETKPPPALNPNLKRGLIESSFLITSIVVHAGLMLVLGFFVREHAQQWVVVPLNASLSEVNRVEGETGVSELSSPGEITADATTPDIGAVANLGGLPDIDPGPRGMDPSASPGIPAGGDFPFDLGTGLGGGTPTGGGSAIEGLSSELPFSGGTEGFRHFARSLRQSGLDIAFVIDSTASMGSAIESAKQEMNGMVAALSALVPAFRLGVVTYRDKKDAYVTRAQDLTGAHHQAIHFLDSIEADGGDDIPEAVLAGLKAAISGFKWSSSAKRIIILVGDAPSHASEMDALRTLVTDFAKQRGVVHTLVTATKGALGRLEVNGETVEQFKILSQRGGGMSLPLAGSTQIVRQIMRVAFGPDQAEGAVKSLDDLQSDWRSRHYEKLATSGEPEEIAEALRRDPPPEILFRELGKAARTDLIAMLLEAITDATLPLETRWAASVVIPRTLRRRGASPYTLKCADALTPDQTDAVFARREIDFRKAATIEGITIRPRKK